jgi:hypothetical protein
MTIAWEAIIPKFDAVLARGLCQGVGDRDGQMCIEAAICYALDLPHGDEPDCVTPEVRSYKIWLNDAPWSSPEARAAGLRDLGIAQIGSKGVVDGRAFTTALAEQTIRVLIPMLFREVFTQDTVAHQRCRDAADRCEREGTRAAAAAAAAAYAAAAYAAAAYANAAADAADAAAARRHMWERLLPSALDLLDRLLPTEHIEIPDAFQADYDRLMEGATA